MKTLKVKMSSIMNMKSILNITLKITESCKLDVELKNCQVKSYILIVKRLALHQNGVEFCQQLNNAIRTNLTAAYNDIQRCMTSHLVYHRHCKHLEKALHRFCMSHHDLKLKTCIKQS